MNEREDATKIAAEIRDQYIAVRVLDDNSVLAVRDLMFTRALFFGCDRSGFARRYCFEDRHKAMHEFLRIRSEDDVPVGFLTQRPEVLA